MLALSLQYDKRHSGYLAELKDAEEVGESQDGCLYRPHQDYANSFQEGSGGS